MLLFYYFTKAVFSGTECVIEKIRAKHDGYNSIMAGCATGAALASRSGPDAMVLGLFIFYFIFSFHHHDLYFS